MLDWDMDLSCFLLATKNLYFPATKVIIKEVLLWLLLCILITVNALGIDNSKSCTRNGLHTE